MIEDNGKTIKEKIDDLKEKYEKSEIMYIIADRYEKGERPIKVTKEQMKEYAMWMGGIAMAERNDLYKAMLFMDTIVKTK